MLSMPKSTRNLLFIFVASSLIVVALVPYNKALAATLPTSLNFNLDTYFSALKQFVVSKIWSIFDDVVSGLPVELQDFSEEVFQQAMGSMGLPDPLLMDDLLWTKIPDLNSDDEGVFTPMNKDEIIVESASEASNQALIGLTLSTEAQEQQKKVKEQTTAALEATGEAAQEAQGTYVTQEVLKLIALQNAQTATILHAQQDEIYQNRVVGAVSAQQLLNLNKREKEKQWQESIGRTASDLGLFDTATQFTSLATAYSQKK